MSASRSVSFALQAQPVPDKSWTTLARRAEDAGFAALYVADHPGTTASPFVALASAAAATSSLQLGTYVLNLGVHDPLSVASDVATLDVVSAGRALLGVGAGHTPTEWTMLGGTRPGTTARIDRVVEMVPQIARLLDGETVTFDGAHITLSDATLAAPRPVQQHVPVLIGGGNSRLLRFAAEHADWIGLTGLGRTLPDGHQHAARWSVAEVDALVGVVSDAARAAGTQPRLDALVQVVRETDDARAAAGTISDQIDGLTVDDALECPFLLLGDEAAICDEVLAAHERWGIDRFTVRTDALNVITRVIARL